MTPVLILGVANTAMTILEALLPKIQEMFKRGEISADDQASVMKSFYSLKTKAEAQFSGPEWEVTPPISPVPSSPLVTPVMPIPTGAPTGVPTGVPTGLPEHGIPTVSGIQPGVPAVRIVL